MASPQSSNRSQQSSSTNKSSPRKGSISTISLEDCEDMYKTNKHPLTRKLLSVNSSRFNRLDKHCKSLSDQSQDYVGQIVAKWIKNPTRDPIDNTKILVSNSKSSTYYKMYELAYAYLIQRDNNTIWNIQEKLPQNHLLFDKTIDLLFYYQIVLTEYTEDIDSVLNGYTPYCKFISDVIEGSTEKYLDAPKIQKLVIDKLVDEYVICIIEYIRFIYSIFDTDFDYMETYVGDIQYNTDRVVLISDFFSDMYTKYYNRFVKTYENNKRRYIDQIHAEFEGQELVDNLIANATSGNYFQNLLAYYDEIYFIYNGKYEGENSPFKNINNKTFTDIQDPLVSILQKIGVENIDLATLKLPKRLFKDDAEWNKYHTQYRDLSTQYRQKVTEWQSLVEAGEAEQASSGTKQRTPPRPEKPKMTLPDSTILDVSWQQFPYYMKDDQYKKILNDYNDSKPTIDLYRELINDDLLTLLDKAGVVPQKLDDSLPLVNKDRQFFSDNVFPDDKLSKSSKKKRCSADVDVISGDKFTKKKYPLAKLNMMFQLKTKYADGDVRIDCFYAPNFYKHIVAKRMRDLPITNPVTNEKLTSVQVEEAIMNIMKIMRLIDPNTQDLHDLMPAYDEKLIITYKTVQEGEHTYNIVSIKRITCDVQLSVCDVCVIPDDINHEDTMSLDNTSAVYMQKLHELFTSKELLWTYLPPYCVIDVEDGYRDYIKLNIRFNQYSSLDHWIHLSKEERIAKFIRCCQELRNAQ